MKTLDGTLSALDVIFARRSVRSYTPDTIQQSTVRALLDAAVQAPTALFTKQLAFVVVQNGQTRRRLSDLTKAWWRDEVRTNRHRYLDVSKDVLHQFSDPDFDVFHGATTLIVICDRHGDAFGAADCWLAAENLMLAASALGLGSRCIGAAVPALNSAEMRHELGLAPVVTAVAAIVIGAPKLPVEAEEEPREPDVLAWK
ncbi:MAG TPA: nitroreductase family protein [Vicinamibacterales bacterium]|jgi:nitroreductase